MTDTCLTPSFLGLEGDRLFLMQCGPRDRSRYGVIFVPPFAEEMNKSRRMFSLVGAALAVRGVTTLLVDLYGTGDSDGEFRDATWRGWQENLGRGIAYFEDRGLAIRGALGVRAGCLLLADFARDRELRLERTVFWQPVADGARYLTQFLRLRSAASMMDCDRPESVKDLWARLRAGETLEVAGYELSPTLAAELEHSTLDGDLGRELGAVQWFEVSRGDQKELSASSRNFLHRHTSPQSGVKTEVIEGEPFWSSTEILVNELLISRTAEVLGTILA